MSSQGAGPAGGRPGSGPAVLREPARVLRDIAAAGLVRLKTPLGLGGGRRIELRSQVRRQGATLVGWVVRAADAGDEGALGGLEAGSVNPQSSEQPRATPSDSALIDALAVAVIVRDAEGAILRANAAAARLLELGGGELQGVSEEGTGLRGSTDWPDRQARETGQMEQRMVGVPGPDGVRWFWATAAPIAPQQSSGPYGVVLSLTDITAYKLHQDERGHRALHDAVTGLPTRALFMDELARADVRAVREASLTGVMFLDVDAFKAVNDRFGHAVGDDLLNAIAVRVRAAVRPADTVARYGGDEFVVLCENIGGEDEIRQIAERVRREVAVPLGGGLPPVSVSVGAAVADRASADLITRADLAMYREKAMQRRPELRGTLQ